MPKISFNAQALGIASHGKRGNMGHAEVGGPSVSIVRSDVSVESLFERLGFADIEGFPTARSDRPTEDIDY